MKIDACVIVCLFCSLPQQPVLGRISAEDSDEIEYVAAVVEHHAVQAPPFTNVSKDDAVQYMKKNVQRYEISVVQAKKQGAQIIVFPEDGIYGVGLLKIAPYGENIPDKSSLKSQRIVPCGNPSFNTRPVLQTLSCIAREHNMAVVANMADSQPPHFFNTDVAFDTDGRLLTKYHKLHLFFEQQFTPNNDPDPDSTFTTSFGVQFGMCTCYDILFAKPCFDYPTKLGVHDLVFPTAWMSAFPLLYSITVQQAFSKMTDTNVLAANMHWPSYRFTGSGIFGRGGDPKAVFISNDEEDKDHLLVARLRTRRTPSLSTKHITNHTRKSDMTSTEVQNQKIGRSKLDVGSEPTYMYKALPSGSSSFELCEGTFCCHAEYDLKLADGEMFAMGVYYGLKPDQPETFYFELCSVVVCASSDESSCGKVPTSTSVKSTFNALKLHASFHPSVDSTRLYPIVFSSEFQLVNMTTAIDLNHVTRDNVWELSIVQPVNVFTAGIFGRPNSLP